MEKKRIKNFILSLFFFLLLFTAVFASSEVLKRKKSFYYKDQFFKSTVPYDVLFFGSSHMHEGIDPIYLWENYGISSYNLASSGESIQMTYYVMREAFRHSVPKAVVIDSFKIMDKEDAINAEYAFVHESIDALPLNKNKLEAVNYASRFFDGGRMAFLSNLYAYHSRYNELNKEDFIRDHTRDKGAYIMTEIVKAEAPDPDSYIEDTTEFKGGDGVRYYEKIIALCREKGVVPILVNIPANKGNYTEESQKRVNTLMKYTEEKGGMSINFLPLLDEIGIDYDRDFGDASHLNFMGAEKTADYIASFLKDRLGFTDHRQEDAYASVWDEDVRAWREQEVDFLKKRKDAVAYIFLADDPDREITVLVQEPDSVSDMYGLDYCLERTGAALKEASSEETKGYDMKVEVRRRSDGSSLAEGFFNRDAGGKYVRADED